MLDLVEFDLADEDLGDLNVLLLLLAELKLLDEVLVEVGLLVLVRSVLTDVFLGVEDLKSLPVLVVVVLPVLVAVELITLPEFLDEPTVLAALPLTADDEGANVPPTGGQ